MVVVEVMIVLATVVAFSSVLQYKFDYQTLLLYCIALPSAVPYILSIIFVLVNVTKPTPDPNPTSSPSPPPPCCTVLPPPLGNI